MNKFLPANDSPFWSLANSVSVLTAVTISMAVNANSFDGDELRNIWWGIIGALGIGGVQKMLAGKSAPPEQPKNQEV